MAANSKSKSIKPAVTALMNKSTSAKIQRSRLFILLAFAGVSFISVSLILRNADRMTSHELAQALAQRSLTILLFGIALFDVSKTVRYSGLILASVLMLYLWNLPASGSTSIESFYSVKIPTSTVSSSTASLVKSSDASISKVWEVWKRQVDEELSLNYEPKLWRFQDAAHNRLSSCPFISGDSFRSMADHLFDESGVSEFDPEKVQENDVVFVKSDFIADFLTKFHDKIKNKRIMLTHNSDYGFPLDAYGDATDYLDDVNIKSWMGQNLKIPMRPKTVPVPIGMGNRYWNHGNIQIMRQKATKAFKAYKDRDILIYVNFASGTNPNRGKILEKVRSIPGSLVVETKKSWADYLEDVARSVFVLSPLGNGIDCHRTWEALILGAIPIVQSSTINPLYVDMPVLVVSSMESLNHDILNDFLAGLPKKMQRFTVKPAFCSYWADKIAQIKQD